MSLLNLVLELQGHCSPSGNSWARSWSVQNGRMFDTKLFSWGTFLRRALLSLDSAWELILSQGKTNYELLELLLWRWLFCLKVAAKSFWGIMKSTLSLRNQCVSILPTSDLGWGDSKAYFWWEYIRNLGHLWKFAVFSLVSLLTAVKQVNFVSDIPPWTWRGFFPLFLQIGKLLLKIEVLRKAACGTVYTNILCIFKTYRVILKWP